MRFEYSPGMDYLKPEEIQAVQLARFREHLALCKAKSPFYREKLKDLSVESFTLDDVKRLPITTKEDLSEDCMSFRACEEREISDIMFTSGSTGKPCTLLFTRNDLERTAFNEQRCFYSAGTTSEDRILLTCTLDRCFAAGIAYYLGGVYAGASVIRGGLSSPESHLWTIRQTAPTVLVGIPSFMIKLSEMAQKENVTLDTIRKIICVGEPVKDRTFQLNGLGRRLQSAYPDAELFATYASSEMATSFCECGEHHGGHVLSDLIYIEVLDEEGNPVPSGEIGEIVATPFSVRGMPLLRYRTGDISFMIQEPCACGRFSPRLGPVIGRKKHLLKCKGTSIYPQVIFNVLASFAAVDNYYITVEGDNLSDTVKIYLSLKTEDPKIVDTIRREIQAVCRISLPVFIEKPQTVNEKVFGLSRKPQHFFDLRTEKI